MIALLLRCRASKRPGCCCAARLPPGRTSGAKRRRRGGTSERRGAVRAGARPLTTDGGQSRRSRTARGTVRSSLVGFVLGHQPVQLLFGDVVPGTHVLKHDRCGTQPIAALLGQGKSATVRLAGAWVLHSGKELLVVRRVDDRQLLHVAVNVTLLRSCCLRWQCSGSNTRSKARQVGLAAS